MKQKSYAQDGEDRYILDRYEMFGLDHPSKGGFYLDVGAGDGVFLSNTYLFEQMGWDGICIEPDPTQHDKARRCRDNVLHRVITKQKGIIQFPCTEKHELSGMIEYPENKYTYFPVYSATLDDIVIRYGIKHIDILSIDTEGTEIEVWETLTLLQPTVVIIEYLSQGVENEKLEKVFEKDYDLVNITQSNHIYKLKSEYV